MPVLPVSVSEPLWAQFSALLPVLPLVVPSHPLGCHRRRIADRVVFDHVLAALAHGSGYERIATPACSDRTIRRRVHAWSEAGLLHRLHILVVDQYDRLIGLDLQDVIIDGCIAKAPGGGEVAGKSPVDRGKLGLKRSMAVDGRGIPLGIVAAGANCHDSSLLAPTLTALAAWVPPVRSPTVHLDAGYDSTKTRTLLADRGYTAVIARNGIPAPIQVGTRWVVERTHAWMNGFGKLRRCTEPTRSVVEGYFFPAATIVIIRCLIQHAHRHPYVWGMRRHHRPARKPGIGRLPTYPYLSATVVVDAIRRVRERGGSCER